MRKFNSRQRVDRVTRVAFVATLALVAGGPSVSAAAPMTVPAASLERVSVPGTTALMASPPQDLARYGYVEEEYYVTGAANRYRISDPLGDAEFVDGGWPYKTRILVRRPADPAKFNGTATVEWYNVTAGQDVDFNWAASHEYLMRNGYAVIAVSAQRVGVNRLKTWSPVRYGDLSVEASNTDPATGQALDARGDVLGWDVFSQVVQALRQPGAVDVLPAMRVRYVIANGESQSAGRMTSYYNSIDPLHRLVDGIVYYDAAGTLRTDSPTKAVSVATEYNSRIGDVRPPDGANYRRWEVAGASHLSVYDLRYVDEATLRDRSVTLPDGTLTSLTGLITGCTDSPLWSTVRTHFALNAAFEHVNRWIQGFGAPPSAPRFERDTGGLRRDANGRVLGGLRLPDFVYPTADFRAVNSGPGFCGLAGSHRYYTPQELAARYPDPHAFVRGVTDVTNALVAGGFVLGADAAQIVSEAYRVFDLGTASATVGGVVPATLSLTVGSPASFGAFAPGVTRTYNASTTATVTSTAGDATLSVADPSASATGRLVNGAFALAQPLQARARNTANTGTAFNNVGSSASPLNLLSWNAPITNHAVTLEFQQNIGAGDALRTGSYTKTLTFTLSTTTP